MEQEEDQRGVCPGDEAFRPLRTPPPREQASAVTGKVSSQMALMSHGSEEQAVPRHKQQRPHTLSVFHRLVWPWLALPWGTELLTGG